MSHPFTMAPMLNAEDLPNDVAEWCLDHNCFLHCFHDIVEVDLYDIVRVDLEEEENPMQTWLTGQGYQFSQEEIDCGWGYVTIFGD